MGLIGKAKSRYVLASPNTEHARVLEAELGISAFLAAMLAARGVTDLDLARRFLNPDLERDFTDPYIIPQMAQACDMVEAAIREGKRIVVFGDFDADGVSASCLLLSALLNLGAKADAVLPRRLDEGYGLSKAACERLMSTNPGLVITVDNGIAAASEVEWLLSKGVSVLVTDHHEPADSVPRGVPVVDPKCEPDNPCRELAGVGVAWKLACALGERFGRSDLKDGYLDLATIGTIGDQMLLEGENRSLVFQGLKCMNESPRPALAAYQDFDARVESYTSEGLAFSLVPRINSSGRMGDAIDALDFLLSHNERDAAARLEGLEQTNTLRRDTESECADKAFELAAKLYKSGQRAVVLADESFHEGVKGIVAARLVSHYQVPVILFSISDDGMAHGSGRTVAQVDLFNAVRQCEECLVQFGGHAAAVGVTCKAELVDKFRRMLLETLDKLPDEQFVAETAVDLEAGLDELTLEACEDIERLQPFGKGNRRPKFWLHSVILENKRAIGKDSTHFSCSVTDGMFYLRAICFSPNDLSGLLSIDEEVDLIVELELNEFRGRREPQLKLVEVLPMGAGNFTRGEVGPTDEAAFLEELEAFAQSSIEHVPYQNISDADSFATKVAGVSFEGRQGLLAGLSEGDELELVREPDNTYDRNAVAVMSKAGQIGYLNSALSAQLALLLDQGALYKAEVLQVTGGEGLNMGCNIRISKRDATAAAGEARARLFSNRAMWNSVSGVELEKRIVHTLIGNNTLHDAQRRALNFLARNANTCAVMATGRGKSLIFQAHAVKAALERGQASVFVYPLRALVNDQSFSLGDVFASFGLRVAVLNGETPQEQRACVYRDIYSGELSCVLTTPEFLTLHAEEFAACKRIGFVAIDEAHHIAGTRSAYAHLSEALEILGNPLVLAVTATADAYVAGRIRDSLRIAELVSDDAVRENLLLSDHRGMSGVEGYLARIVGEGEKTLVYVNSRKQTVRLSRLLRQRCRRIANSIAFYNAGLKRDMRLRIEGDFRSGRLKAVVATSAFGEGINIPDVRNVVLYHMPFSAIEFNQMSGRCGRDGRPAYVHLLFNEKDSRMNERILKASAPTREDLVVLWKALKGLGSETAEGVVDASNADLAALCSKSRAAFTDSYVSSGLSIFRELGIVESWGFGPARKLRIPEGVGHVELGRSARFMEGRSQLEEFESFRDWVLSAEPDQLLSAFNRPILPS